MRIICPYCGKSQDGRNTVCQFCQAKLPQETAPPPGTESRTGPTSLCAICMMTFPAAELKDYEGQKVCDKCLQKALRRDTSMAPSLKKPEAPEESKPRPRRRFAVVFLVGLLLISLAAGGIWQGYRALCRTREQTLLAARKELRDIVERGNQALVMLVQPEPDAALIEDAKAILYRCKTELGSESLRALTASFEPLEEFRGRLEQLQRLRWQCASTLTGEPVSGGPPSPVVAKQRLLDSSNDAKTMLNDLVRGLRLYGLSIDGLVVY